MKSFIMRMAFIVSAIIACSNSSQATVTFKINVEITADNCIPSGYQGNYVIYCTIRDVYGTPVGIGQKSGISYKDIGNPLQMSFQSNIDDQLAACNYSVELVVCRQTTPLSCCSSPFTNPGQCWDCLVGTGSSCPIYYVSL